MVNTNVVDIGFGFSNDVDDENRVDEKLVKLSLEKACVKCKDKFGRPNVQWIADVTGISVQKVIVELRGKVIIQNPSAFMGKEKWDPLVGWLFLEQYLCGNIASKLLLAEHMEKRFPKCFEPNVDLLKSKMPKRVAFDSIKASLGAPWVPVKIYENFISELFGVVGRIDVFYIEAKHVWKILVDGNIRNCYANRITYGTPDIDGIDNIERTMNARSVIRYGEAAKERQRLILNEWDQWLHALPEYEKSFIEESYNSKHVGYAYSPYDGSFLSFADMSPNIKLYDYQRDAIARILLSPYNVLLAHEVGAGKTYILGASAHELKRMGLCNKIMITVPKNKVGDAAEAHMELYPNDNILVVYPKDFTPKTRDKTLEKIRDNDYVAIYIGYGSFDKLCMSKAWWVKEKVNEIKRIHAAITNSPDLIERNMLRSTLDRLRDDLEKFKEKAEDPSWLCFDDLGVDCIMADECQNFKNISLKSKTDCIVGMHTKGSKRANEMLAKCKFCKKKVFATGTPLTNSLADLFVLQTYLQPEELELHGLNDFDMWINTFATREEDIEVDLDGNSLRPMTRFSRFHNIPELMSLFSSVCDFHFNDYNDELPEWDGYIDIVCDMTPFQKIQNKDISKRIDIVKARKVDSKEDNRLKIFADSFKTSLDDRMRDYEAINYYYATRKVAKCAEQIREMYDKYPNTSQIVYSDIGTPKADFNIYDALREELELLGIPSHEIAYVHSATTEAKRKKMFDAVNEGRIRIIIGSTAKLGTGVNVQQKLIAAHHLSVPYKPSEITQRNGRIIRKFNTNSKVFIFRYITPNSLDSYMWQLLQNKQKFIDSFLSGACSLRDADDIGDILLDFAEIKAACIGNKLVKTRVETANKIERTKMLSAQRQTQLFESKEIINNSPTEIARAMKRKNIIQKDIALYEKHKAKISNAERVELGEELLLALQDNNLYDEERYFDSYQGFDIMLPANMLVEDPYIYVRSSNKGLYYNRMKDVSTPLGCTKSIDYLLDHLNDQVEELSTKIYNLQKDADMARATFNAGNPYEDELDKLYDELKSIDDQIKKESEKNVA